MSNANSSSWPLKFITTNTITTNTIIILQLSPDQTSWPLIVFVPDSLPLSTGIVQKGLALLLLEGPLAFVKGEPLTHFSLSFSHRWRLTQSVSPRKRQIGVGHRAVGKSMDAKFGSI